MNDHQAPHAEEPTPISTGMPTLDTALGGGLVPGGLYVLGGRVMTGKSLIAQKMALSAVRQGHGVMTVSLEGPPRDFVARILSIMTGLPIGTLHRGASEEEQQVIREATQELKDLPGTIEFLEYQERAQFTVLDQLWLHPRPREYRGRPGGLVIVDYLQMAPRDEEMERVPLRFYSSAVQSLARLAATHRVAVLLVTQLSHSPDEHPAPGSPPCMEDLDRITPEFTQRASAVLLAHRDDVEHASLDARIGEVQLIVGSTSESRRPINLAWVGHFGTLTDSALLPPHVHDHLPTSVRRVGSVLDEFLQAMPADVRERLRDTTGGASDEA